MRAWSDGFDERRGDGDLGRLRWLSPRRWVLPGDLRLRGGERDRERLVEMEEMESKLDEEETERDRLLGRSRESPSRPLLRFVATASFLMISEAVSLRELV